MAELHILSLRAIVSAGLLAGLVPACAEGGALVVPNGTTNDAGGRVSESSGQSGGGNADGGGDDSTATGGGVDSSGGDDSSATDSGVEGAAMDDGTAAEAGPDGTRTDGGAEAESGAGDGASEAASATDAAPPSDLLYYFPFAGDTNDYSGNRYNATSSGPVPTTGHSGKPNTAYLFNGTSSYMTAPGAGLPVGNAARTLTLWVNPSNATRQYGIVSWGQGNCTGYMFGLGSQGGTFWGGCDDVGSGAGIPTGTWTFLAAVFTPPAQIRLFVNGVATTYTLTTNLNTNASSLWIGGETTTNSATNISSYFAGAIDSIRIYRRALSDAEVTTVMGL